MEDEESGLHQNRWRYYDTSVGTYCSADPLRISGGKCFWTYVVDPLRSLDPLGLVPHETSRRRALQRAQQHAQVPSAGRKITPFDALNEDSRGRNFNELQSDGASGLGWRSVDKDGNTLASVFDHPDGHPTMVGPPHPPHHAYPHIHAVNIHGEEVVITYDGKNDTGC